ncbi:hypothetical protein [Cyclobacterium sp.]|uniref:hypothetical protein n=1 Tax=Cyclobacterium sp. TaxID=1966343 RepID=UPI0019A04391|nr:hypothetical protein [Cyclobacterium sp.]MBD3627609.1 hypothetical protein [Cyclobacterium sp.]
MSKVTKILDGKYEVLGVKPGPIGTFMGIVDLSKIDEATAERLVARGSSYLRKAKPSGKKIKDKEEAIS